MSNKYTKFTLYTLIAVLGYANFHLAVNNATTGQNEANPAIIRADENLGSGISSPVFFKLVGGNIVSISNGTWGFRIPSLPNCNTIDTDGDGDFLCGSDASGGGGGTQIEIQNSFTDLGSFSSLSFDAGHFTVTDTTGEATVKLDWLSGGGPASKSQANTWTLLQTFTLGASSSAGVEINTYASASLYRGLAFGATEIDCNDATDKLLWSAGLFTCGTLNVADTGATGGVGVDINTNDFTFDSTEVEAKTWGGGAGGTIVDTYNLTSGDPTMTWTPSGATLSLNFEILGYASVSNRFFVGSSRASISTPFEVSSTATSSFIIDSSGAGVGGCLVLRDRDGGGYTYITAQDGVLFSDTISCR